MKTGRSHTLKPQHQLWLAVWRHSRGGWIGLGVLVMAMSAALVNLALGTQPGTDDFQALTSHSLLMFAWFLTACAGLAGALLSAAWVRLMRGGVSALLPRHESAARHLGVVQACTVWLVSTLAMGWLLASRSAAAPGGPDWTAFALLGLPALGVALGVAAPVFGRVAWLIVQATVLFAMIVIPTALRLQWLSLPPATLPFVSMALGAIGPLALAAVLRLAFVRLSNPSTTKNQVAGLAGWVTAGSDPVPAPNGIKGLWMIGLPMSRKGSVSQVVVMSLSLAIMLLAINPSTMPWNGLSACVLLAVASAGWQAAVAGIWASPRLALVPGGWQRQSSRWSTLLGRIAPLMLKTDLLVMPAALLLVIAALWQPPWQQWSALPLALLAVMVLCAASMMVSLPAGWSPGLRILASLSLQLTLAGSLALMSYADWPLADEHPASWLARAAVMLTGAVVLGGLLLHISRRAWQRMDWARQPVSPLLVGRSKEALP